MSETQFRLPVSEVAGLAVICPQCDSEAVFNGDAQCGPAEVRCPNCGIPLGMEAIVQAYRTLIREVKHEKRHVLLVVPV